MRFRIVTTLAALAAVIGILAVGAGTAAAHEYGYNPAADPQTTNVPWLAWAGSTVKVSRCFGIGDSQVNSDNYATFATGRGLKDPLSLVQGTFTKRGWSGDSSQPPLFTGAGTGDATQRTVSATWYLDGGGVCFSANVQSGLAGMEDIFFTVNTDLGDWLNELLGQDIIFQQDLFVIWMWDSSPVISEAGDTGAYTVGDPGGSGAYKPIADSEGHYSFHPGLIDVNVTGTFPLGGPYAGYGKPVVTLPTDWVWLANTFAESFVSGGAAPGSAAMRWDIHDDDTAVEGHSADSGCAGGSGAVDAVDNCQGSDPETDQANGDLGPFSSIFGQVGVNNDAIGPFDPVRSYETLLSDGNLNADDAPMPPLQVNVSLTNSGDDHAAGYLSKADKSLIYNRNDPEYGGNGSDLTDPHQLYAPFYQALIPAVTPLIDFNTTSGVMGALNGNGGNYLTWTSHDTSERYAGVYDYWDTFTQDYTGGYNNCYGVDGEPISKPDNVDDPGTGTSVAVYTDEHGQAMVQFNPANPDDGEGINLTPDGNGRCDVYTGSLIGNADIQAAAQYPEKQAIDPTNPSTGKLSNTISKTVEFTPNKVLTCISKGKNEAYCVETVTDFEGNPIKADVEFTAQGSQSGAVKIQPDSNPFGGFDPSGQTVNEYNALFVDLTTDPDTGQAAIAVHDSVNECVDVSVENLGTSNPPGSFNPGIYRDFDFNPATGTTCGTNDGTGPTNDPGPPATGGGGGTPSTGTGGSSTSSSGAQSAVAAPVAVTSPAPTAAPAAVPTKVTKSAKMTLVSARVISSKNARFLNVRVNSAAKSARLRITLVKKNGSHAIVFRYVATNKVVRVANLRLGAAVKTVRVAVA